MPETTPSAPTNQSWFASHKTAVIAGGIGVVVLAYLYIRSKNAAAASTATGTSELLVPTGTSTSTTPDYNSLLTGTANVASGLQSLQDQFQTYVNSQQAVASGSGSTVSPPPPQQSNMPITVTSTSTPPTNTGSTTNTGSSSITWNLISNNTAATVQQLLNSGQTVYYFAGAPGQSPGGPVSSAGPGTGWVVNGQPLSALGGNPSGPAGQPSGFYTQG